MKQFNTEFNIGDFVYPIFLLSDSRLEKCPDCGGSKTVYFEHHKTSEGKPIPFDCSTCQGDGNIMVELGKKWTVGLGGRVDAIIISADQIVYQLACFVYPKLTANDIFKDKIRAELECALRNKNKQWIIWRCKK